MIQLAMKLTGVTDPAHVVNVGDTPLNLQAGTSAGCGVVIGVLTGIHRRERLEQEPHTRLIASSSQLSGLFQ
jgi:phosphoglycolate phosphatase-like HAD superfamily hydrolase